MELNLETKQCVEKTEENCKLSKGSFCYSCPEKKHLKNGICVDNDDENCLKLEGDNYCIECSEINNNGNCETKENLNCDNLQFSSVFSIHSFVSKFNMNPSPHFKFS